VLSTQKPAPGNEGLKLFALIEYNGEPVGLDQIDQIITCEGI
jgi:hypothetical protein